MEDIKMNSWNSITPSGVDVDYMLRSKAMAFIVVYDDGDMVTFAPSLADQYNFNGAVWFMPLTYPVYLKFH